LLARKDRFVVRSDADVKAVRPHLESSGEAGWDYWSYSGVTRAFGVRGRSSEVRFAKSRQVI